MPLARRMKNRMPQGWMIPQYRTLKSKLPKYRLKKAQYRNTVSPHVPLPMISNLHSSENALAYTLATNEGVIKAIGNFYRDDSDSVFLRLSHDLRPSILASKNVCVDESNTRLGKWRATLNAFNSKINKN